jgi:general secretion pathway protein H
MIVRRRGFTLIEILVVLIIVAIITAVAVIAFGQFGRGRRERIVAEQFIRVIRVAQQQAILTPAVLGLGISVNGYQFYEYEILPAAKTGEWKPLRTDVLSNKNAFQRLFSVDVKEIAAFSLPKTNAAAKPAILFLPSGYVTPFVLELKGSAHNFTIKNNGVETRFIASRSIAP